MAVIADQLIYECMFRPVIFSMRIILLASECFWVSLHRASGAVASLKPVWPEVFEGGHGPSCVLPRGRLLLFIQFLLEDAISVYISLVMDWSLEIAHFYLHVKLIVIFRFFLGRLGRFLPLLLF